MTWGGEGENSNLVIQLAEIACCYFDSCLMACRILEIKSFPGFLCSECRVSPEGRKRVWVWTVMLLPPVTLLCVHSRQSGCNSQPRRPEGRRPKSEHRAARSRSRDNWLDLLMTPLINIESLSSLITVQTWRGSITQPACTGAWHYTVESLASPRIYCVNAKCARTHRKGDPKLHLALWKL